MWDEPLIKNGAYLIIKRLEYLKMLSDSAKNYHSGISGEREKLEIKYISSVGITEEDDIKTAESKLRTELEKKTDDDIRLGVTNTGPHRDDIEILINGRSARSYASQGQQRSAVLSLKLAEAGVLRERMGEEPVILLDDVLSELDSSRQDFLLNELTGCQVFITCCEESGREQLKNGKIFNVRNGEIF